MKLPTMNCIKKNFLIKNHSLPEAKELDFEHKGLLNNIENSLKRQENLLNKIEKQQQVLMSNLEQKIIEKQQILRNIIYRIKTYKWGGSGWVAELRSNSIRPTQSLQLVELKTIEGTAYYVKGTISSIPSLLNYRHLLVQGPESREGKMNFLYQHSICLFNGFTSENYWKEKKISYLQIYNN